MADAIAEQYQRDFYSWLMTNAELLREGKLSEIDAEHVAEELEGMGRSERRALVSRLTALLVHLLKWQFQPARRSRSWRNTLTVQRSDVLHLLEDSPSLRSGLAEHVARRAGRHAGSWCNTSLRSGLAEHVARAYRKAKLIAEDETGVAGERFPEHCPYWPEQVLDQAFFPESEGPLGA